MKIHRSTMEHGKSCVFQQIDGNNVTIAIHNSHYFGELQQNTICCCCFFFTPSRKPKIEYLFLFNWLQVNNNEPTKKMGQSFSYI